MSEYTRRNEADELRDKLSTCHDYIAKLEAECKVLKEKLHEKELAVEHNRKVADEASKMKAEIDLKSMGYYVGKNTEPQWIPVSDGLPEEHEWIGTKRFGTTISDEVYVTFEGPKGERFCEHLSFQNGKISPHAQRIIDAWHKGSKPIAWKPFPEPYEGDKK